MHAFPSCQALVARFCTPLVWCLLLGLAFPVRAQGERPFVGTPLIAPGARTWEAAPAAAPSPSPTPPESPLLAPAPFFAVWPLGAPPHAGEERVVRVQLLSRQGLPQASQTVSATLDRGRILQVREVLPGEHEIRLLTPATETPISLQLSLETQVEGVTVTQKLALPVLPRVEPTLTLRTEAPSLRMGRTRALRLELSGRHADGRPIRVEELELRAAPGRIDRLKTLPEGRLEAYYLPPDDALPQHALIAAFSGQGAYSLAAFASVELIGTANIPVSTEPGAMITVEVDGKVYGPQRVPASGQLTLPVPILPSSQVLLIKAVDRAGNRTQTQQDLGLQPALKGQLHLDRSIQRTDELLPIGLTLVQLDVQGQPVKSLQGRLLPGSGQIGGWVERAPGIFVTELTPPSTAGRHEVRWELPGGQILSETIEVLEGSPSAIQLKVTPERIRSDDPPAEISLVVTDRRGQPATAVVPRIEAPLGTLEPLRRIRPGEFVGAWRPPTLLPEGQEFRPEGLPVPVTVTVQRLPEAGPVTRLVLRCATPDLRVGGGPTACMARPLNLWGAPIAGVQLLLEELDGPDLPESPSRFPPLLTTNAQGEATFVVYPDRQVRAVRLRATVLEGGTTLPGQPDNSRFSLEQGLPDSRPADANPAGNAGSTAGVQSARARLDAQRSEGTLVIAETLLLQWAPPEATATPAQPETTAAADAPETVPRPPLAKAPVSPEEAPWRAHRAEADRERLEAMSGIFQAQTLLTLIASRVRQAEVVALPNTLFINARQTSAVTIRLYDQLGKPVSDQGLKLITSAGFVSEPRQSRESGEYRATYTPPPVLGPDSRVRITATNAEKDYEAAAEIQLIRPEGRTLGSARIGYLSNFGALTAPNLSMQVQTQLPGVPRAVYLCGEIGYYFLDASTVRLDIIPLQLLAVYRYPLGTATPYAGVGPLLGAVVAQREVLNDQTQAYETLRSGALFPGVGGKLGLELALGPGGVAFELGLTFLGGRSMPELGLDVRENLGGASFTAGYVAHF